MLPSCAGAPAAKPTAKPAVEAAKPREAAAAKVPIKDQGPGAQMDYYVATRAQAFSLRDQGKGGQALDLANAALELFPDASDLWWVKVSAYRQLSHPDKALAIVERLIAEGDLSLRDHFHEIGDLYGFDLNDPKTSIEWYGKQIQRDPVNSGWSYHHRGVAWLRLGDYAKARTDLTRAQAIAEAQKDGNLQNSARDNLKQVDQKEAAK
jgi:tetratricopeptide (TPR) repeat protein